MDSLIWIVALVCIGIAIGAPSWLIIQITKKLSGRALDHDSLYGWATVVAIAVMFMLPSREHTTRFENITLLVEALSGGAAGGALLNIVYQWTFKGTETEKAARSSGSRFLDRLLENKIVSTILGGVLVVVLIVAALIVLGVRMNGTPLLNPLVSFLLHLIHSVIG